MGWACEVLWCWNEDNRRWKEQEPCLIMPRRGDAAADAGLCHGFARDRTGYYSLERLINNWHDRLMVFGLRRGSETSIWKSLPVILTREEVRRMLRRLKTDEFNSIVWKNHDEDLALMESDHFGILGEHTKPTCLYRKKFLSIKARREWRGMYRTVELDGSRRWIREIHPVIETFIVSMILVDSPSRKEMSRDGG
jgi:hypothetical protein